MQTAPLNQFKQHPAQMRTVYDLEALAQLTLQVYERGLDSWQPIVAAPNGDGYYIVSGHRRHMATLLASTLADNEEVTLETVRKTINALIEASGDLTAALSGLQATHGAREIPFVPFAGDQRQQILALQSANFGRSDGDPLGIARSFRAAVKAGVTPERIAANAGQHLNFVNNHLALTEIPEALAELIASGVLPMSVGAIVAELPEPKRAGLATFLIYNTPTDGSPSKLRQKQIKACAKILKGWSGLQQPLMVRHQAQRNMARVVVRLWTQALTAYPEDAYAAAALLIYQGVHEEPWADQNKLAVWFQTLGGEAYYKEGGIYWPAVVQHLLTEVSCQSCPISKLPKPPLAQDIAQDGGVLGIPCRVNEPASRCIHGFAPDDPVRVRVPPSWAEHPGVEAQAGSCTVNGFDKLQTAWLAQQAAEAEPIVEETSQTTAVSKPTTAVKPTAKAAAVAQPASRQANVVSPIIKQREKIHHFMNTHVTKEKYHPFATPCAHCQHKLTQSPVKDETAPHCAWAKGARHVLFVDLVPETGGLTIPVCKQYAPTRTWRELIPPHPDTPNKVNRGWLKQQIVALAKDGQRHELNGRRMFQFLTGRPMKSSDSYGNWFETQLGEQIGELSDAQLYTLFLWAHAEWERVTSYSFTLPIDGHTLQFATYQEVIQK